MHNKWLLVFNLTLVITKDFENKFSSPIGTVIVIDESENILANMAGD